MNGEFVITSDCRILRQVKVPMRDGIELATTVYLPLEDGVYPTVLIRSAYNRIYSYDPYFPMHGMALVIQDCRGRYDSDGEFYPFINEENDGFDALEWVGNQPWCDGNVGMLGNSYLAATQFSAALSGSRYLKALNPLFMAGDYWKQAYYSSGVFSLALTWSWFCFEVASRASHAIEMPLLDVPATLKCLPISKLDEISGSGIVSFFKDYVAHGSYGPFWESLGIRNNYDKFKMPVLLVGGWYDYYPGETAENYLGLLASASSMELADSHRMIIGPWTHGMAPTSVLGELDFEEDALTENDCTHRWLECILKGRPASEFQQAPIRLFVMGANQWRDEYEWPLERTQYIDYYLHQNSSLTTELPTDEQPDSYTYDPDNPVPTLGGNHSVGPYNPGLYDFVKPGPYDQRPVEQRADVLVYTSEVLEKDVEVTGPIVAKLHVSTSAPDTDFVARLTDVYPDGRSMNITEGVIRMRFKDDVHGQPKLIEPGETYEIAIELLPTSNLFKSGHCIRLQITSSNFPLWDRNLNTGEDPGTGTRMQTAEQTVYHDAIRASCITLPIIDS
jgi:putative CocE/NonD family hydrolase